MSAFNLSRRGEAARLTRYHIRRMLGRAPALYLPLARLRNARGGGRRVVTPGVELVIEGFPRCANTFAVIAFRRAQPRPVRLAHHVHLPAQVLYAVKRGIPALVLIRAPEPAIISYMLRRNYPGDSPTHALLEYLRFYQVLRPYRRAFVLSPFEQVTRDFGAVIRRVNDRYGTDFGVFEHTPEQVAACFKVMERCNRRRHGGRVQWSDLPRPDSRREAAKGAMLARLRRSEFADLLARANAVYREFIES